MKKTKKKIVLSLFFILSFTNFTYAQEDVLSALSQIEVKDETKGSFDANSFSLGNLVDNILNNENQIQQNNADKKSLTRREFIHTTSKFNQGNAKVAYDEYDKLIDETDNDLSLLALSKIFNEIGFFSLARKSGGKIFNKNQYSENIQDLELSYRPRVTLSTEDEIYWAKRYSSIYFEGSAIEVATELHNRKNEISKNDYAQYTLSRAYLEAKKYNDAISAINKAINLNPLNVSYQMFKLDILIAAKKYKEARNLISKLESQKITINFIDSLNIKKQIVLAALTKNDSEKKYYMANKSFQEGNFEKTKKDCQNILNFDKDNAPVITLYAKSELALGNVDKANLHYVNSYKLEKNNNETLIGLGDIRYLHGDYKNSVKMYKKALKKDKDNYEILIKLSTAQRQYAKNPKELRKLEAELDKMPKTAYKDYYSSAISIAQNNSVLKEEFLKRALNVNPMYENALGELIELYLKNKDFQVAKGLIYSASFTLSKNYYYYYLCGLYNQAINKPQDAIQFYKTSLSLNPNFEIANTRLLKLIPNKTSEEI